MIRIQFRGIKSCYDTHYFFAISGLRDVNHVREFSILNGSLRPRRLGLTIEERVMGGLINIHDPVGDFISCLFWINRRNYEHEDLSFFGIQFLFDFCINVEWMISTLKFPTK